MELTNMTTIILGEVINLIIIIALYYSDGVTYKTFGIPKDTIAFKFRLKEWHLRAGVIQGVLSTASMILINIILWHFEKHWSYILLYDGLMIVFTLLLRMAFCGVLFNYFGEIKPLGRIGGEAITDKFFKKYFGDNGEVKKMWFFTGLIIILNIAYWLFIR